MITTRAVVERFGGYTNSTFFVVDPRVCDGNGVAATAN